MTTKHMNNQVFPLTFRVRIHQIIPSYPMSLKLNEIGTETHQTFSKRIKAFCLYVYHNVTHRHCIQSQALHCVDQQRAYTGSEWAVCRSEAHRGKSCKGSPSLGKADWWGAAEESFQSQFYVAYIWKKWKGRNNSTMQVLPEITTGILLQVKWFFLIFIFCSLFLLVRCKYTPLKRSTCQLLCYVALLCCFGQRKSLPI